MKWSSIILLTSAKQALHCTRCSLGSCEHGSVLAYSESCFSGTCRESESLGRTSFLWPTWGREGYPAGAGYWDPGRHEMATNKGRRGRTSRRRTVVHSGREGQAIQAGGGVLHEGSDATIARQRTKGNPCGEPQGTVANYFPSGRTAKHTWNRGQTCWLFNYYSFFVFYCLKGYTF